MKRPPDRMRAVLVAASALVFTAAAQLLAAQAPALPVAGNAGATAAPAPAPLRKFRAVDADNHNIFINKPGLITLLLGTSEDSQEAARSVGKVMYPLQGRPDFQLIVVVDLRNSIAAWVPSVVLGQMRANLDREALALKPYFLKNGNKSNPRSTSYVIADFNGTICPQLGWTESSDDLRAILFGADGRELERFDKVDDMARLQTDSRRYQPGQGGRGGQDAGDQVDSTADSAASAVAPAHSPRQPALGVLAPLTIGGLHALGDVAVTHVRLVNLLELIQGLVGLFALFVGQAEIIDDFLFNLVHRQQLAFGQGKLFDGEIEHARSIKLNPIRLRA